jgi:mannan endo-1,4-beta-mannosidase
MTRLLLFITCFVSWELLAAQPGDFVRVKNTHLVLKGKPYYFIGTNYWYGSLLAYNGVHKERLLQELDFLAANGINNLRVLVGAEGEGQILGNPRVGPALQPGQGKFDSTVLKGLDFLLAEIGPRNMKAVLFISNNWEWSGGFLQYLNWNGLLADSVLKRKLSWDETRDYVSMFYGCTRCVGDYMKQLQLVVNRTNTITQKKYRDDRAIMAWEIANEPRPMRPAAIIAYKRFLSTAAAEIKAADKNHLVTIGTEGDIGTENGLVYEDIHRDTNIDYLTIHIWPKNWSWYRGELSTDNFDTVLSRTTGYIQKHVAAAGKLGKPLVIEEFGLPRDGNAFSPTSATRFRDAYYRSIFSAWQKNSRQNGVIAGCNFWAFSGKARPVPGQLFWKPGDDFMGDPPMEEQGLYGVFDSDATTWRIISSFAKKSSSNKPAGN